MDLAIGRIAKVHGIRGDVVIDVRTDSPEERFAPGVSVRLAADRKNREARRIIESARWHGSRLLVKFQGVNDRDAAELLRGRILVADSLQLSDDDLDDDEFHDTALIGLKARLVDGTPLGTVTDVLHTPGGELLVVSLLSGFAAAHSKEAPAPNPHDSGAAGTAAEAADAGSAATARRVRVPKPGPHNQKTREILVPFVRTIVTDVDTDAGSVIIDAPDGLLDM